MRKMLSFNCVLVYFISCSQSSETISDIKDDENIFEPEKVLFIGNSHTYYNHGVDYHVGKILEDFSLPFTPILDDIAKGGYTLRQHIEDQETLSKIQETDRDVVVFQENTSIVTNERDQALASIQDLRLKLGKETRLHLFMTWQYENEPDDYTAIKNLYEEVAPLVKGNIVPVAVAFHTIQSMKDLNIALYDADGVHATLEGTFLAAAMFAIAIYDVDPSESTYSAGLPNETADYLKRMAKEVYLEYQN